MSDKTTMQLLLEARFQQLAEEEAEASAGPAPQLREEVFRTLDLIDLVGEVGDLFTGKFGEATTEFLDLLTDPEGDDDFGS
ncbi:hypothetical protein GGR28_002400 [Lewinella aquimaris]|uniref:Uncharacterized protein n=1 Tax=Neolewinella aquimaris TaxID=1835722 RepID=A0A840E743_9BACT|nr:hypothetical protein [Neolewinella aquimaris]MBB4079773.1 hypothetical protein [Neolewinella aquimaris]